MQNSRFHNCLKFVQKWKPFNFILSNVLQPLSLPLYWHSLRMTPIRIWMTMFHFDKFSTRGKSFLATKKISRMYEKETWTFIATIYEQVEIISPSRKHYRGTDIYKVRSHFWIAFSILVFNTVLISERRILFICMSWNKTLNICIFYFLCKIFSKHVVVFFVSLNNILKYSNVVFHILHIFKMICLHD